MDSDRGLYQVAGPLTKIVGRTVIEVKATHIDQGFDEYHNVEDGDYDIELHLDDGTSINLRSGTADWEGIFVTVDRWRPQLTGKYPWELGRDG